jgi:single-stranded-DNA-specific exonuclease
VPDPAKRWHVCPVISESFRSQFSEHSPLVLQILYNRGLSTPSEVSAFLGRSQEFHNPFLLRGMNEAVTRIRWAIQRGETLAVYGDFDADGVTATVLLTQTLAALGARVVPYIPHRVDEGYGLHKNALTTLARMPVQLVITVDCGIRSVEEVAHARQLGLDMILTDHHSVGPDLPQALAVVNPRRPDCPYPFKDLAGVGVAFKLAQALIRAEKSARGQSGPEIAICEEDLLDLVAIGTIADVVPLIGENRHLVKRGLDQLNRAGIASSDRGSSGPARAQSHHEYPLRPGLRSLMHEAGVKPGSVDAATIGFVLGPRLNAAGRLKSAMLSYELLQTADQDRAEELAQELGRLNRSRQKLTRETVQAVREQVQGEGDAYLHLVAGEDIEAGIAGLVAGRLAEEFYRPTVVVEKRERWSKGSCRSIAEFNITLALDRCADLLQRHGGHAMAAGFTVATDRLPALKERLQTIAEAELAGEELLPTLSIDAEVELQELDWATYTLLGQLEPFGYGNPAPLLLSRGVEVKEHRTVGAEASHLKLTLSDGQRPWDAIAFRLGEWDGQMPRRLDVAYTLEVNEWNGRKRLQLNVQDLQPN